MPRLLDDPTVILAKEKMMGPMDDPAPRRLESLYSWCLERQEQGDSVDDLRGVLIDLDLTWQAGTQTQELAGLGRLAAGMLGMGPRAFIRAGARLGRHCLGDAEVAAIKSRCDQRVANRGKTRDLLQAARAALDRRRNVATGANLRKVEKTRARVRAFPGACFQDAMDQCKDDEVVEYLRGMWRSLPIYVQQRRKRRR